jgi:hypothetical protein
MFKNTAGQKVAVYAYDLNGPKTGDAANITGKVFLDGAAANAIDDTNPTELDSTNAPGVYVFDLTQAETNGDMIVLQAKSTTVGVQINPIMLYTVNPSTKYFLVAKSV